MNEGFCFDDGAKYFKYEKDALAYAKTLGYKTLEEAYEAEEYYHTAWEDESDFQYIVKNGKLVEIEEEEEEEEPIKLKYPDGYILSDEKGEFLGVFVGSDKKTIKQKVTERLEELYGQTKITSFSLGIFRASNGEFANREFYLTKTSIN